jgi:hypothetical protein
MQQQQGINEFLNVTQKAFSGSRMGHYEENQIRIGVSAT